MWTSRTTPLSDGRGLLIALHAGDAPLSYEDVLRLWQSDSQFRTLFIGLLADAPYDAFRWETPPVTARTVKRPFECVLLDSPSLAREPAPDAFAEHFRREPAASVLDFTNLGRDAIMIVPRPSASPATYVHLAAFLRGAPEHQKHELWRLVGAVMTRRLGSKPAWLSTAGAGVAWLHVRIDDRPKYYGYQPFRSAP